jgi:hypothetical protein
MRSFPIRTRSSLQASSTNAKAIAEVHAVLDVVEQPRTSCTAAVSDIICKSQNNTRHISEDARQQKSNPLIVILVAGHLAAKKFTKPAACLEMGSLRVAAHPR